MLSDNAVTLNTAPLEQPRPGLVRGSTLPAILAVLILIFSLLISYALWNNARRAELRDLRVEFNFRAREIADAIVQRMDTYQQVLHGVKGFMLGAGDVRREDFHVYVESLELSERYPGIQAIALAQLVPAESLDAHVAAIRQEGFPDYSVHPPGSRDIYTAITLIEPFNDMNRRAFGYDMYSDAVRAVAMGRARDTGLVSLSGTVTLVQEADTDVQRGFLIYMPLYRPGMPTTTLEERRAALTAWIYAPFRVDDFISGVGGERSSELRVSIYDRDSIGGRTCVFACSEAETAPPSLFNTSIDASIAGRNWLIDVHSRPSFEDELDFGVARIIAVGGAAFSLLLALLVWALASGRSRAEALATRMTGELRASARRIAAEQQRMEVILENSHDAFVATDIDGRITDWNRQSARLFGWSAEEALGQKLSELVFPGDRVRTPLGLRPFPDDGPAQEVNDRVEAVAVHRDGYELPVELAVATIRQPDGFTSNAFIRDLRSRKETEERESLRQKALEEARIALQRAQKLEAVGKLTGGVAHDFNNVLQIISGSIQLLLNNKVSGEDYEKRLNMVMAAVERGAKLSSQLLAFARRQPLQPAVINLARMLRNMDDLLRRALGESIEIETVVAGGLWNTLVDPNQLENVILNLAINARDAMQGSGKLTIELGNAMLDDDYVQARPDLQPGQYVEIAITDTGSGMSEQVIEQVFEPFFTTKPEGEGTGLGLSMAFGFVKQSGGHIQLYSEPDEGTTVRIYLPRSLEEKEDIEVRQDIEVRGGTERILVVEDDAGVQEAVVGLLIELGYTVLRANNGQEALEVIRSGEAIDLLFTDVVMPGPVRSTELVRQARELLPGVAVLFTSGYTHNAIVHGGRLDPGVELISKPYRREQLARKLRHVFANQMQLRINEAALREMHPQRQRKEDIGRLPEDGFTPGAARGEPAQEPVREGDQRVLVVEDNNDMRELACLLLSTLGAEAQGAGSAEEALEVLSQQRFDILFTDIGLTGMNGEKLAERARRMHPDVQVVFATGYADVNETRADGSVVLKKPYGMAQLRQTLQTLQRSRATPEQI